MNDAAIEPGDDPNVTPLDTSGAPLPGAADEWTYTEFPDAWCRDGSQAGVATNLSPSSNKLMIYLEGGAWCIDGQSCDINPSSADQQVQPLGSVTGSGGVFDRSNDENPVRDWNFVYVPYCTGDFHAGANPFGDVAGVGAQKFVGYLNMKKFLKRIVPTFKDTTHVLLTGSSAGGYGALLDSVLVQSAFPKLKLKLKVIDDSGPPLSNAVFAQCLQDRARMLFAYDKTFLAECGADCPHPDDYMQDFALFLAQRFGDRPLGLIASTQDSVLRSFFTPGNDDCIGVLDFFNPDVSVEKYRTDVLALRDRMEPFANVGTFIPEAAEHTWTILPIPGIFGDFYATTASDVRLVDWFAKIVHGENPGHAGP